YGRAWLALLLSELGRHPGRDTARLRGLRRGGGENVLDWLRGHRTGAKYPEDRGGVHRARLFPLLPPPIAAPPVLRAAPAGRRGPLHRARGDPRGAGGHSRRVEPPDFPPAPPTPAPPDPPRGRSAPPPPPPASRAAERPPLVGHAVGAEMTRLWPVALSAR